MGKQITIDLHGLYRDNAKKKLLQSISSASNDVESIYVIHGSNNGTILLDLVRNGINSPRIDYITPSITNPGATTIYLKKKH